MTVRLFDAACEDTAGLAAFHATAFDQPWTAKAITDLLVTPGTFAFHSRDGFVLARAAGGEAEILTLAVTPQSRRRGVGRALVQAAAAEAQRLGAAILFLEVATANQAGLALYQGMGFVPAGVRKAYYSPGSGDALVLKAQLPLRTDFP